MAAIAIIGGAIVALILIAKYEGVDVSTVSSTISDLGAQVSSDISSVGVTLGISSDPMSVALPLIKQFEGFSASRYPDPAGQSVTYSIGYGHQIRQGDPSSYSDPSFQISTDEATTLLRQDATAALQDCIDNVSTWDQLSVNQQAALISFRYNIGGGNFASSTMLSLLNQGDFAGAADQFPRWIHANGAIDQDLVSRRDQEQALFNS